MKERSILRFEQGIKSRQTLNNYRDHLKNFRNFAKFDSFDDLFHVSEEEYGENYSKFLLEQYKQFLQMIDNLTQRRTLANSFF